MKLCKGCNRKRSFTEFQQNRKQCNDCRQKQNASLKLRIQDWLKTDPKARIDELLPVGQIIKL